MRPLVARVLGALLLVTAMSGLAAADGREDQRRARLHFKQGTAFLEAGDADSAIREYEEALRLYPSPRLHFNLGQAYRIKGDARQAIDHFRKFLEAQPDGADADEARRYVVTLTRELPVEQPAPPPPPSPGPAPVPSPPPAAVSTAAVTPAPTAVAAAPSRPVKKRWPIWVGVTVGVLAAGAAATVAGVLLTRPAEPVFTENLR